MKCFYFFSNFCSFFLQDSVENWAPVFYISAAIFAVTGMVYVLFATAQEQPWGRSKPEEQLKQQQQQQKEEDHQRKNGSDSSTISSSNTKNLGF